MPEDGLAHCCRKLPAPSNSTTFPVPASATHRLPPSSTATPTTLTKWPCGAVVPSIVANSFPAGVNFRTTLLPASPTYTVPCEGVLELSTAMLVGLENWPAPDPGMPAWHFGFVLQTWLASEPSRTPQPHAARNAPLALKLWIRAFALSAT